MLLGLPIKGTARDTAKAYLYNLCPWLAWEGMKSEFPTGMGKYDFPKGGVECKIFHPAASFF